MHNDKSLAKVYSQNVLPIYYLLKREKDYCHFELQLILIFYANTLLILVFCFAYTNYIIYY